MVQKLPLKEIVWKMNIALFGDDVLLLTVVTDLYLNGVFLEQPWLYAPSIKGLVNHKSTPLYWCHQRLLDSCFIKSFIKSLCIWFYGKPIICWTDHSKCAAYNYFFEKFLVFVHHYQIQMLDWIIGTYINRSWWLINKIVIIINGRCFVYIK